MATRITRSWLAPVAVLAITALTLASPALAVPGEDPLLDNTGGESGGPMDFGGLLEADFGGETGVATYEMVSLPGSDAPHALAAIDGSDAVSTVTATLNDDGAFLAVLIIDDADDPTEFRFEGAVPVGHIAEVESDGSVTIYDAYGNPAGGLGSTLGPRRGGHLSRDQFRRGRHDVDTNSRTHWPRLPRDS